MTVQTRIKDFMRELNKRELFVKLLVLFILISPTVDILTSIGKREFNIDISLGILVKGAFLGYVGLRILLEKPKSVLHKVLRGMVFLFIVYAFLHLLLVYTNFGLSRMILAAVNMAKAFFLPIFTIGILRLLKKEDYKLIRDAMFVSGVFIILTLAISMMTRTDYNAYKYNKLGTVGWFFAANEVSAFIGILTPMIMFYLLEKWKVPFYYKLLPIAGYIAVYYQIGTKVVGLSVILITGFLILYYAFGKIKNRNVRIQRQVLPLLLILAFGIGLIPMTPIGINMNIHLDLLKYEEPEVGEEEGAAEEELSEDFNMDELLNNNPQIVNFIFSGRDRYFAVRKHIFEESTGLQKVFGLSQFGRTDEGDVKSYIVEIDYVDIFFNFGVIGTILYWSMILVILLASLRNLIRNKLLFELGNPIPYILSAILLAFGIGMFAGHVFVSPAVSMYIAIYVAMLYSESSKQKKMVEFL